MDTFLFRQQTQWLPKDFLLREKNYMSAYRFSRLNVLVIFTSCHAVILRRSVTTACQSKKVNGSRWRKLIKFHGDMFSGYCPLDGGSVSFVGRNQRFGEICIQTNKMHKIMWLDFIFYEMLYMFRTILVHHQEQLYKLYIAFGVCRYMPVPQVWLSCG